MPTKSELEARIEELESQAPQSLSVDEVAEKFQRMFFDCHRTFWYTRNAREMAEEFISETPSADPS
jgi:hypothetical protein